MNFPNWIPELVRPLLAQLNAHPVCVGRRRSVFDRLLENPRMKNVYGVFLQLDRETSDYRYPAKSRKTDQSAEDAQIAAIGEVLKVTISAASDRISVSRIQQIQEERQRLDGHSKLLQTIADNMELAAELGVFGFDDPSSHALALQDSQALRRVAAWFDHLRSVSRRSDDPLVVARHRGNPIARGVQILIGSQIEEYFGERLDGTAATLTAVALDTEATPRASRSALT